MQILLSILDDVIRNAVGGASIGYWAKDFAWNRKAMILECTEQDTNKVHRIEPEDLARAVGLLLSGKYPKNAGYFLAGNADGSTGDLLVQLAVFGEEKYA